MRRILELTDGVAMVVTDIHGNLPDWMLIRDKFLQHHKQGEADRLVLCGDLLHTTEISQVNDRSYELLQDVMRLQLEFGRDVVIMLSGNHEMPHIYDVMFSKGTPYAYNAHLEWEIKRHDDAGTGQFPRAVINRFLRELPYYIVTKAGVTLSHAGAPPYSHDLTWLEIIADFDHDSLLQLGQDKLKHYDLKKLHNNRDYREKVYANLALVSLDDPRFTNLLRGEIIKEQEMLFRLLWNTLFLSNERDGYGRQQYLSDVEAFLKTVSTVTKFPQRVLTAGHVVVDDGFKVMSPQKLRFASAAHANPKHSGVYLLLDCAKPVQDAAQLVSKLRRTWGN